MSRDFTKNTANYMTLPDGTFGSGCHGGVWAAVHCFVRYRTVSAATNDNAIFAMFLSGGISGIRLNLERTASGVVLRGIVRSQAADVGAAFNGTRALLPDTWHSLGCLIDYPNQYIFFYVDGDLDSAYFVSTFGSTTYVHSTAAGQPDGIGQASSIPPVSTATQLDGEMTRLSLWRYFAQDHLSLSDWSALADGVDPFFIKRTELIYNFPLGGFNSPEITDTLSIGSATITGKIPPGPEPTFPRRFRFNKNQLVVAGYPHRQILIGVGL